MSPIGQATPDDALALLALHRSVLTEGRWFVSGPDELPDTLASLSARLSDYARSENSAWFVARRGRSPVAFLRLTGGALARTRHVARLEVMVHASQRGRGLGRALIAHAIDWARDSALLTKVSLAVFDDNTRAIALYAAFGFVEEGRRVEEYREADGALRGDVLMALSVG